MLPSRQNQHQQLSIDTSCSVIADGSPQHGQLNDVLKMRGKLMASPSKLSQASTALKEAAAAADDAQLDLELAQQQVPGRQAVAATGSETVCIGFVAFVLAMLGVFGLGLYFAAMDGAEGANKNLGIGLCAGVGFIATILFYMHKNGGWWM